MRLVTLWNALISDICSVLGDPSEKRVKSRRKKELNRKNLEDVSQKWPSSMAYVIWGSRTRSIKTMKEITIVIEIIWIRNVTSQKSQKCHVINLLSRVHNFHNRSRSRGRDQKKCERDHRVEFKGQWLNFLWFDANT